LDSQETLDDGEGVSGLGSGQQLCGQALGYHRIEIRWRRSPGRRLAAGIGPTSVSAGNSNSGTARVWANWIHNRVLRFAQRRANPGHFAQTRATWELYVGHR
jgi:hypothetical protein